jgi:hypothetical protein
MFLFFSLIFISCPKPYPPSNAPPLQKRLEWNVSSVDPLFESIPNKQDSTQDILSYWHAELIEILAKTPCSSDVSIEVKSYSGKILEHSTQTPNSFGEIQFTVPVHRVKKEVVLTLHCVKDSDNTWHTEQRLRRNQTPLPKIYSPKTWQVSEENTICFLDALQGSINIDFRQLGRQQDEEGFNIGVGEQEEWQELLDGRLHQPLQCIDLKPSTIFSDPIELRLRLKKDGLEQEMRRIITPKPSIWVSTPKSLEQGANIFLELKVDSPSDFSLIDLQIQNGPHTKSYKIPLSDQGLASIPFQANSSGFYQIIASFGKVRTETSFWVQPKQLFATKTAKTIPWLFSPQTLPEYTEHSTPFPYVQRVLSPEFLRLGDKAKEETFTWDQKTGLSQTTIDLPSAHFQKQFSFPILLSPADEISIISGTERINHIPTQQIFQIVPSEQPYYLTTDSGFSTRLILDLLSEISEPHHPITDAHFLQRASLAWTSLAIQKAPWFELILNRSKENLQWLEAWQQEHGWQDPNTDWLVIHSLLQASRAGLSPKTTLMFSALEHLCTTHDSPKWQHLRWDFQKIDWNIQSCQKTALPIWKNKPISDPQTEEEWTIWLLKQISSGRDLSLLEGKMARFYLERPQDPWLQFAFWLWEQQRYQSYHNLRISLKSDTETLGTGFFHTWQRRTIFEHIESSSDEFPLKLQVKGVGSLHWGLWQFTPTQRPLSSTNPQDLKCSRRLLNSNQEEISASSLKRGDTLYLEHKIKGLPMEPLILQVFPPANLIFLNEEIAQGIIFKEIILDKNGEATIQMPVLSFLSGSFQFPASQIRKHDIIAHSGDWLLHSQ